jgi:hypothetical protein
MKVVVIYSWGGGGEQSRLKAGYISHVGIVTRPREGRLRNRDSDTGSVCSQRLERLWADGVNYPVGIRGDLPWG